MRFGAALAGLPTPESLVENFRTVTELLRSGKVVSAYTPGFGGPQSCGSR